MNTKDHYTDIFDEKLDAPFEQQMEQIAALYSANEPPAQLSWSRFQLQMPQKNLVSRKHHRQALRWMRPDPRVSPRLALALGLLVFLLVLSGFTYAIINLGVLGSIFNSEPASQQLLQTNQFTILQQSQLVDGHKVTLDKAYADANRIILGIIVTDPQGLKLPTDTSFISNLNATTLKTQQGQVLSFMSDRDSLDISNPKATKEGTVLVFDGAGIQGNPSRIPLNLTIGVDCSSSYPPVCKHTLTYNFTLPFHPGRVINLHQTITANKHALTLERVIVTPSETRLSIRWQKEDVQIPAFALLGGPAGPATYIETLYDLQLSANGQTYHVCQFGGGIPCRTGFGPSLYQDTGSSIIVGGGGFVGSNVFDGTQLTQNISLFQPLYNQHGTWTLTITKFGTLMEKSTGQSGYSSTASPSKDESAAPWVFTFNAR